MPKRERAGLQGLHDLASYYDDHIGHALASLVLASPREQALISLVQCARSILITLCKTSEPREFRARFILARAIWEHYVLFESLRRSGLPDAGERFLAYAEIERWTRYVRIQRERRKLRAPPHGFVDAYLADPHRRERMRGLLVKFWNVCDLSMAERIRSWDGGSDKVRDRARSLGLNHELAYLDVYSLWSWAEHGSIAPVEGMSEAFVRNTATQALTFAFHIFGEMTQCLLRESKLEAIEERNLDLIRRRFHDAAGDDAASEQTTG